MSVQVSDRNGTLIPINFLQFSGGERHVQIAESVMATLTGTLNVQARMQSSDDIIDYLLLESVLFDRGLSVNLEIPYFPYARQDRACAVGQAFSLEMMTRLLNVNTSIKTNHLRGTITVWDCHSPVTTALLTANTHFNPVINISPVEIIQQCPALVSLLMSHDSVLICPDHGAKNRTASIADYFNQHRSSPLSIVYCDKKRDPTTGKILNAQVNADDLSGKTAIITDDICDGGATFIGIAQALRRLNCDNIILYVTHGIFSRGLEVFTGLIDHIFTSNSFLQQNPTEYQTQSQTRLTVIPFTTNLGASS